MKCTPQRRGSCGVEKDGLLCIPAIRRKTAFSPRVRAFLDIIARQVNSGESIDQVLDLVWKKTLGIIPRDRIGLSFVEEDGARVTARYFRTDYKKVLLGKDYSAPLAGSSLQSLLLCGRVRIIPDLEIYLQNHPQSQSTRLLVEEGVRTSITLPLLVDKRPVGFMFFSSRKPGVFSPEHVMILLEALDRISQAVEKAWIIKRLEDANRNYVSMLGFVSHEIKSPLAGVMARGFTYLDGYSGSVDKVAAETIRGMIKTAGYLTGMVGDYIDLSRLESGELRFKPRQDVDFGKEILDFAMRTVAVHAERRHNRVRLDVPARPILVRGDPQLLVTLSINLLDNAVKYGNENEEILVAVSVEDGCLTMKIRNQGVGFTQEQAKRLFLKFSRLQQKGTEDRKGSGLGLYLAWWIAHKHGGSLTADSLPGQWAQFTLKIPNASLKEISHVEPVGNHQKKV